ncbi:hypothetical protein [Nonomuraea sp. NPDC049709]|uniref:hypothetical protein n=1 Tax=Nonomuraea sp. NPDC049709 TaxID=3154736 RepID=UPI0034149885
MKSPVHDAAEGASMAGPGADSSSKELPRAQLEIARRIARETLQDDHKALERSPWSAFWDTILHRNAK